MEQKNVRTRSDIPAMPPTVISRSSLPFKNNETHQMSEGLTMKEFIEGIGRFVRYIQKALGIIPEDEPICSDHPPLHSVDGELRLGNIAVGVSSKEGQTE